MVQNGNTSSNSYNDRSLPQCPKFKLYSDEKDRIIDKELFDRTAKEIANSFKGISPTKFRRFFDEVKSISRRPDFKVSFDKDMSHILLKSKISYMIGRAVKDNAKEVPALRNLQYFINQGLKQSIDAESYLVFVLLFEAVYGFYYEKNSKVMKKRG